jgi:hypothetical protein
MPYAPRGRFWTSELEWPASRLCCFTPLEWAHGTPCVGDWVGPEPVWTLWRREKWRGKNKKSKSLYISYVVTLSVNLSETYCNNNQTCMWKVVLSQTSPPAWHHLAQPRCRHVRTTVEDVCIISILRSGVPCIRLLARITQSALCRYLPGRYHEVSPLSVVLSERRRLLYRIHRKVPHLQRISRKHHRHAV